MAEAEGIEVTEEDLDAEFVRLGEGRTPATAKVRKEFERADQVQAVRSDLKKRKALEWLLEHVEIVDEEGQPIEPTVLDPPLDIADEPPDGEDEDPSEQEEAE